MPEQLFYAGALFANLVNHNPTSSLFYGQTVLDKQTRGGKNAEAWAIRHDVSNTVTTQASADQQTTNTHYKPELGFPLFLPTLSFSIFLKSSDGILYSDHIPTSSISFALYIIK